MKENLVRMAGDDRISDDRMRDDRMSDDRISDDRMSDAVSVIWRRT
jgi:hypothetical protein